MGLGKASESVSGRTEFEKIAELTALFLLPMFMVVEPTYESHHT